MLIQAYLIDHSVEVIAIFIRAHEQVLFTPRVKRLQSPFEHKILLHAVRICQGKRGWEANCFGQIHIHAPSGNIPNFPIGVRAKIIVVHHYPENHVIINYAEIKIAASDWQGVFPNRARILITMKIRLISFEYKITLPGTTTANHAPIITPFGGWTSQHIKMLADRKRSSHRHLFISASMIGKTASKFHHRHIFRTICGMKKRSTGTGGRVPTVPTFIIPWWYISGRRGISHPIGIKITCIQPKLESGHTGGGGKVIRKSGIFFNSIHIDKCILCPICPAWQDHGKVSPFTVI